MKKETELAKKEECTIATYAEEGFTGIEHLPVQPPRWKVEKDQGVFYHTLTNEQKRILRINPLLSKGSRALWQEGEELPVCSSQDCISGTNRDNGITGPCATCGNNQFGTSKTGKGKACKQSYLIMGVEEDSLKPFLLAIPVTSLKLIGEYFQKLSERNLKPREAYAELSLKETSSSGFTHQLIVWDIAEKVSDDRLAELNSLVASYQASFSQATVERDEQVGTDESPSQEPGPSKKDYKKAWEDTLDDPSDDPVPF